MWPVLDPACVPLAFVAVRICSDVVLDLRRIKWKESSKH